jgi:hypothetical protein
MAIVKIGTFTTTLGGAAQNLNLGFIPSYFKATNDTTLASGTGLFQFEWYKGMANASAYTITTAGTPVFAKLTTNGVTPFQSTDVTLWTPTRLVITGITNAAQASVTATHSFTAADVGVTTVTFSGVVGMTQINTLRGVIQSVTSTTSFTVNINTTTFSTYTSGGIANIITGVPATETLGFQTFNTPQHNTGFLGLTFGTTLMANTGNTWFYQALLDASFTSD